MSFSEEEFSLSTYQPGSTVPVVYNNRNNERCLAKAEWGFIPHWDRRLEHKGRLYNIRVETALESLASGQNNRIRASFAEALQISRCIFPVADFREYSRRDRQVMRVLPGQGQDMLCLAGIYGQIQVSKTDYLTTLGVLTRPDSRFGRFPIILDFGTEADTWLDVAMTERHLLIPFLRQLGYTERSNYYLPQDDKPCVEPPPDPSPQTRLFLP